MATAAYVGPLSGRWNDPEARAKRAETEELNRLHAEKIARIEGDHLRDKRRGTEWMVRQQMERNLAKRGLPRPC
jgi:hypothetical protein